MTSHRFLAFDLGASNGRAIAGLLSANRFEFEEIHRFPTRHLTMQGVHQWDAACIYEEMLTGIAKFVKRHGPHAAGIGIDTWGVDFGLLASDGTLLANPAHYRDRRTEGMPEIAFGILPEKEIYRLTGIGFNRFNTLYQLLALAHSKSPLLDCAGSLLLMGDLFNCLLTGRMSCEHTNATTTQLLDPLTGTWQEEIIYRMGFPRRIFRDITPCGTVLGPILPEIAEQTGLDAGTLVITPATHDTASAIASAPVENESEPWAYISCGTWSIMGTELDKPLIDENSFALGFSNEGGANGRICFHKTFIGLWLLQECRRIWKKDGMDIHYDELIKQAAEAEALASLISVDDPRLYAPANMIQTIQEICRETGLTVPETQGALARCSLESMAAKYSRTLREMDKALGRTTSSIHIFGGGAQNQLLCQFTADACGVPVFAGPVEAAILGNFAVQARAFGMMSSLADARQAIRMSSSVKHYAPQNAVAWNDVPSYIENQRRLSYAN
ncbi:MAG: rhamnulokinase family protein [bacterium]|nr:rhamnulokinase [Candidatus Sumerlaeota bacterium]